MKIYIACGLTHVPRQLFPEYASIIHALANECRKQRFVTQVRYALVDSDPQLASKPVEERAKLCYLWDRDMVEDADLIIAEASFPSIGLGVELQIAAQNNTPIILAFSDFGANKALPISYENPDKTQHSLQIGEGYISLMALGLPSVYSVVRYDQTYRDFLSILNVASTISAR